MTVTPFASLRRAIVAAALCAVAAPASAQLPNARSLVDRYIQEIGGERIRQQTGMRTTGSFSMPAMGASGQLEMVQARPNRMVMKVTLPGLGEIRSGFDGEVGWSLNPMEGPRLLTGPELTQTRDDATFDATLRDPSVVASMETVEKTEIAGRTCFKVRITWKSGRESFDCYDAENGLLIATMQKTETAMGTIDATVIFEEYREFQGVKLPTRTRQQVMSQEFLMTIESVQFGAVPDSMFAPPPEVKALIR